MDITVRLYEQAFSRSTSAAREARQWVRESLAQLAVFDPERTAELLVSELVSNTVIHTGSQPTAWVAQGHDRVRIHVHDTGVGEPVVRRPGPRDGTGRGLGLVEALALRWGVDRDQHGKTVWFEVPGPPRGGDG